jgi:hypothetical protein
MQFRRISVVAKLPFMSFGEQEMCSENYAGKK